MTDVIPFVRKYLSPQTHIELESSLRALGMDQLDQMTVALDLEDELDISIPDFEYEEWLRVADIDTTVRKHLEAK